VEKVARLEEEKKTWGSECSSRCRGGKKIERGEKTRTFVPTSRPEE